MTTQPPPDHDHAYRPLRSMRGPVGDPPGHTMFEVLVCPCGVFDVFPRVNYALVNLDFRAIFESGMASLGFRRVVDR